MCWVIRPSYKLAARLQHGAMSDVRWPATCEKRGITDAQGTTMKQRRPHTGSQANTPFRHKFATAAVAAARWSMLVQSALS
jgi:hypothetical protein